MSNEQTDKFRPARKVHMVSLGCPKNLVDAEIMLANLQNAQYSVTQESDEADTIIVNTCSFIEESRQESVQTILDMAKLKGDGKLKKLVVSGCLPQRYKDDLAKELPEVDVFIGSGSFQEIAKILDEAEKTNKQLNYYHLPTYLQQENTPRVNSGPFWRAYVKISEGCLKRCAFCAIPAIRGNLQSRKLSAIVNEVKLLVAGGVKEINIVSHDFTDYGWDLRRKDPAAVETPVELLRALSDIKGLEWIRVLYLYPDGITPEMVSLIKERKNLVKYFDMPLQHINDEVLKSMNRKMTRAEVESVLNNIRTEIPEAVIRTQFIVGFPGETEDQFQELMGFVEEQRFDRVGCFKYSPEEKTAGEKMLNQIDEDTKQRRHDELMEMQMEISREKHLELVGKIVPVLVEGESEESELLLQGRTSQQAPDIDGVVYINDGTANPGDFVNVKISEAHDYDLVGEIV